MKDKRGGQKPPSEPSRETEQVSEEKKGKSPNHWAAASFVINLWRLVRDWLIRMNDPNLWSGPSSPEMAAYAAGPLP
ncbi:hypothetical protein [Streptomyces sp. SID1121]|uniref:hypothetical protein n=1 Tax=Streptomyces sp. SID1121 TaxID=3425888 RepID=UPI00405756CC